MSWLVPILLLIATTGSAAENSSITSSAQQSTESVEICPFDSNAYGNPCTHADCTVNAESVQCTNVISGYCQQRNRTKSMDPGCFDIFSFVDYDIPSVTTVYPAAFTTTGVAVQTTTLGPPNNATTPASVISTTKGTPSWYLVSSFFNSLGSKYPLLSTS